MAGTQVRGLLGHVRHLLEGRQCVGSDGELLERFIQRGDETAFAALVHRYGPLVMGVCRRMMRHEQDAEDVFQATFLVLARKAYTIRKHVSIGSWLFGVARHLAARALTTAARRARHESRAPSRPAPDPREDVTWCEVQTLLDDELAGLPDQYRAPLLLCYFEGLTQDEAANQLGWKKRTVKARLARGRDQLRRRLTRRGLDLSAVLAAPLLASRASASVPASLTEPSVQAALRFAGKRTTSAVMSAKVMALAQAGLQMTSVPRLAVLAVGLLSMLLLGGTAFLLSHQVPSADKPPTSPKYQVRTDLYGDPLPPGAVARLGTERFRHGNYNKHIAWVPGASVVVSGEGQSLRFWDPATGKLLRQIVSPDRIFTDFAFTPDGSQIVSFGNVKDHSGSFSRIWDTAAGREIRTIPWVIQAWPPSNYRWGMDWKTVVTTYEGRVTVRDLATGVELRTSQLTKEYIDAVALSPDGKTVAIADESNPEILLWEWDTDVPPRKLKYSGARSRKQLVFSPDGKLLASHDTDTRVVRLWDVSNGTLIHKLNRKPTTPEYMSLGFSSDGRLLVGAVGVIWGTPSTKGAIYFWDTAKGNLVRQLEYDTLGIGDPILSPDGRFLAAGSLGGVRVWDLETGKEVAGADDTHRCPVSQLAVTAGGLVATGGEDGTVRLWHSTTGRLRQVFRHPDALVTIAMSPNGQWLAVLTRGDALHVRDAGTGREIYRLPGHGKHSGIGALVFSPNGNQLSSWGGDRYLRRWDLTTGKAIDETSLEHLVATTADGTKRRDWHGMQRVVFSPDGSLLLWNIDKHIFVINVASTKVVRVIATDANQMMDLAISPNQQLVAASAWSNSIQTKLPNGKILNSVFQNHPVRLWDLTTGKLIKHINLPDGGAGPVAFSPDGKLFAAGVDVPQGLIRLWNLETGTELPSLTGFSGAAVSLAFTPDGKRLISGMRDSNALVWDLSAIDKKKP
jgi:RNA polymerase sigma factor (sigma-70 family)